MPALASAITTVRMSRTTVQLTEVEAATTAPMLMLEGGGDVAVVELSKTVGGKIYWRVTKSGSDPYTYAVETSTDGTSFTADGGSHDAGDVFTSTVDGYACTMVFNDTVATITPPTSGATGDPFVHARFT